MQKTSRALRIERRGLALGARCSYRHSRVNSQQSTTLENRRCSIRDSLLQPHSCVIKWTPFPAHLRLDYTGWDLWVAVTHNSAAGSPRRFVNVRKGRSEGILTVGDQDQLIPWLATARSTQDPPTKDDEMLLRILPHPPATKSVSLCLVITTAIEIFPRHPEPWTHTSSPIG